MVLLLAELPLRKAAMKWLLLPFIFALPVHGMLASSSLDASIKLDSLDPKKLDNILDEKLERLQVDVFRMYQDQLRNHQEMLSKIGRQKRQVLEPVAVVPPPDFGHAYTFDTGVGNREVVVVDSFEFAGYAGSLTVTNVFHLGLSNLTAIYKAQDGFGYVMVDGSLQVIKVRNEWTKTTSGCRCDGSSPPIGRSHESCACCVPNACLCKYGLGFNGDSCVPCGTEAINCPGAGPKNLELDAAVGFEFVVPATGLKRIVITAKSTVISFFEFDGLGLQVVRSVTGLSTLTSVYPVTHLGYGESYVSHYGLLKKKRFLITFCAGQQVHQLHELSVGSSDTAISAGLSTIWQATGSAMKASQSGGRLMITVLDGDRLQVYELKEDLWREFKFLRIQRLSLLNPITTWGTFSTGFENYLFLVSRTLIRIFIQSGLYYNSLTTITTDEDILGFENLLAINLDSCRNDVVLLAGSGSRLVLYTFNRTVVPNTLQKVTVFNVQFEDTLWNSSYGYLQESKLRLVLPGPNRPVLYDLATHLEEVDDLSWRENLVVANTIRKFNDAYRLQAAIMNAAEERLLRSVDASSNLDIGNINITITHSLVISQTLVTNVLVARNLSLTGTDIGGTSLGDYDSYFRRLNSTKGRVDLVLNQLEDFKKKLEGAVSGPVSGNKIGGILTIINPGPSLQTLLADNFNVNSAIDKDGSVIELDKIFSSFVRLSSNSLVRGSKKFVNGLIVGEINSNFLDDIPVSDLVMEREDQDIQGAVYSSIFFAKEIILRPGASVAGIDFTKAVELNLAILGHVISQTIEVENLLISDIINGVDLRNLLENALLLTGGEVTGSLTVNREILINVLYTTEIMGIEIDNFLQNVVFKDKDAVVNGKFTVGGKVVVGNVRIDGKINNKSFDYPLRKSSSPIVFRGQKNFINVKFDNLKFGPLGNVDGINQRNLITKSTSQVITEHKVFGQGIQIGQNLEIRSKLLDGVNLSEISQGNSQLPITDPWAFDVVFVDHVTVQSLRHSGAINGLDFSAVTSDFIYKNSSVIVSGRKRFLGKLSVTNSQINGFLNGEDLNSLVITGRNNVIGGYKTFIKSSYFNTISSVLVDGVDLGKLVSSALNSSKEGNIVTGKKVFTQSVFINALDLTGRLSNIDFSNVVTKDTNQKFIAQQIFSSVNFNDLKVQSIRLSGNTLNGINILDLAARRLSQKTSVPHTGTLVIDGPVNVIGSLLVDNINGVNIQEIERNIVVDNGDSSVSGSVIIQNLVASGSVTTLNSRGANGLSLRDTFLRAAKLTTDNKFLGAVNLADVEISGQINVSGLVNGVDLATLRDDAVYINSRAVVTGNKLFLNGFNVKGNFNSDTTNGIDLSSRLFTLNTDQHISSSYYFENVAVKKNVLFIGRFREIDLRNFTNVVTNAPSRYGAVNFGGNLKVSDLIIDGTLNGRNLVALFSDGIPVRDSAVFVTGKKSLTATTQFKSLNVRRLNTLSLGDILSNAILRNSDKVVIRPWTLNGILTTPWLTAEDLFVEGSVDRVDYLALLNDAVYVNRQQNLQTELIFEENLVVNGNVLAAFLNGRSLLKDYLTLHTDQSIMVDSHLATVFSSFVEVGGTVNGIYLPHLKDLTMQVIGGQMITGATTIKGTTTVLGNIEVTGRTGTEVKVDLGLETINLSEGGEIKGLRVIPSVLITSLSSSVYLINGINIAAMYESAVFKDRSSTVTARLLFTQSVTFKLGLVVSGRVDALDVGSLYNSTTLILSGFGSSTAVIKDDYASMCNSIVTLYDQLEDSLYEGDCFEFVYSEFFTELRHSSFTFNAFGLAYLIVSYENQCYSEVYVWRNTTRTFKFYQSLSASGYAHKWVHTVTEDKKIFLASAASSRRNYCINQNSSVWEVFETSIQRVQILSPGETVSKGFLANKHSLNIHSSNFTITYVYDSSESYWKEVSHSERFEHSVHALGEGGFSVSFRSNRGVGELWVGGIARKTLEIGFAINDAVLVNHHHRLLLFVVVTVLNPQGPTYELRAYETDDGNLVWLDTAILNTPGKLTVFFVGNEACGAVYIAVTQEGIFPLIFNFFGETLSMWTQMMVPGTTWIEHFNVENDRFPRILDNYLIFGRDDKSALVYYLKMRGSTVPKIENSCVIEEFKRPLLKPNVFI